METAGEWERRMEKGEWRMNTESEAPSTESGPGSARSGQTLTSSGGYDSTIQPLRARITLDAGEQLSHQINGSYVK